MCLCVCAVSCGVVVCMCVQADGDREMLINTGFVSSRVSDIELPSALSVLFHSPSLC